MIMIIKNEQEILDWAKVELVKEGVTDFSQHSIELRNGPLVRIKNGKWRIEIESGNQYTFTFNDKKHREHGPAIITPSSGFYYKHGQLLYFPHCSRYEHNNTHTKRVFSFENRSYMFIVTQYHNDQAIEIRANNPPRTKDIKKMIDYILENYNTTLAELLLSPDEQTRKFTEAAIKYEGK